MDNITSLSLMKTGVLLINTGSPDTCKIPDVKKYLQEFLMDEKVIDIPEWKRKLLVNWIIVPFRAKKTAALYQNIWDESGSPLINTTRQLVTELKKKTRLEIAFAMRYGNPSIKTALSIFHFKGIEKIIIVPMFPHYAMSTFESIVEKTKADMQFFNFKRLVIIPPFYDNNGYINAIFKNIKKYLNQKVEALVISYHSLPKRHILKSDPTEKHCLKKPDCCARISKANQHCYRAQTWQTTKMLTGIKNFPALKVIHSYQSAMNKNTWIGPDTQEEIINLARSGKKNIAVVCPGFVTDNLETLEEINIRSRNVFIENGGKNFTYIPSLNAENTWVDLLKNLILNEIKKK